jgi:hypothetical protein
MARPVHSKNVLDRLSEAVDRLGLLSDGVAGFLVGDIGVFVGRDRGIDDVLDVLCWSVIRAQSVVPGFARSYACSRSMPT